MNKKFFVNILSLVLMLVLLIPTFTFADGLNDIESSYAKEEIEKLVEDGIISGYPDGSFRPERNITRGELSKILAKSLKLEEDIKSSEKFVDVQGKWYAGYVGALYKAEILKGKSETKFAPEENITRQELAVIIIRLFNLEEKADDLKIELEVADNDEIASWAKNAVGLAYKMGLMKGIEKEDGTILFAPKTLGERQLVAKLIFEKKYNFKQYDEAVEKIVSELKKEEPKQEEPKQENTKQEDPVQEKPSYNSIVSKYRSKLESLQSIYEGKLDTLVSKAKSEYNEKKNEPDFSATNLFKKYEKLADELEVECDAKVDVVLSDLRTELTEYGYETKVADELYNEYIRAKDDKENEILN